MKQVINLEALLVKLQTGFGSLITPLTSADYVQGGKMSINMDNPSTDIETVGALLGQDQPVNGPQEASLNVSFPLRSGGAQDSPGAWTKFIQCCGFYEGSASHKFTYLLGTSAQWKDATAWGYTGAQGSGQALIRTLSNLLFSGKITLDFTTGLAMIDFSGKGVFDGLPVAATQPTVVRQSLFTPSLIGYTGNIFGDATIDPLTVTIDFGNEISVCVSPAATDGSGKGMSLLTKTAVKYDFKYYVDHATTASAHAKIKAGDTTSFTITWGTEPNLFTIADAAVALKNVKENEQNGVKTYDVSGVSVGNGISIDVDTTSA